MKSHVRSNVAYCLPPWLQCRLLCRRHSGASQGETKMLAEIAVTCVTSGIKNLDLTVAAQKTKILLFHKGRVGMPPGAQILVDGVRVSLGTRLKYLGLQLDSQWNFGAHFRELVPRVGRFGTAVSKLMSNLGGLSWRVRWLYLGVVASVAFYRAPIWAGALAPITASL